MRSELNVALLAGCTAAALLLPPLTPDAQAQEVPFFPVSTNLPVSMTPPEAGQSAATTGKGNLSFWAGEMIKLAEAGIDDSLKYAFIDNTAGSFNLGADEIILLTKAGLSSDIISAMLQHDYELTAGLREPPASSSGTHRPIHIVLVPKEQLTNTTSASTAAASARASKPKDEPIDPLTALTLEVASTYDYPPPPEKQSKGYAVREPHPVKVLPPIIVIRGEGRVASVREYQIESEPEPEYFIEE